MIIGNIIILAIKQHTNSFTVHILDNILDGLSQVHVKIIITAETILIHLNSLMTHLRHYNCPPINVQSIINSYRWPDCWLNLTLLSQDS